MEVRRLNPDELQHHGVKGQKWGVRRYQNPDGSLKKSALKRYKKLNQLVADNEALKQHHDENKKISEAYRSGNKEKASKILSNSKRDLIISRNATYLTGMAGNIGYTNTYNKKVQTGHESIAKHISMLDNKINNKSIEKSIARNQKQIDKIIDKMDSMGFNMKTTHVKKDIITAYNYLGDTYLNYHTTAKQYGPQDQLYKKK